MRVVGKPEGFTDRRQVIVVIVIVIIIIIYLPEGTDSNLVSGRQSYLKGLAYTSSLQYLSNSSI